MNCFAMLVSIALQYGVPLEVLSSNSSSPGSSRRARAGA